MAKKNFGTKRIRAGSAHARQITRFIDDRRGRSASTGRYVTRNHGDSPRDAGGGRRRPPG